MARKKQTSNPIVLSDGSVDDGKGRIVTTSDGRKVKVDALASSEYWRRREARQQTKNIRDEQKIGEEMKKIYLRMFRESQTQIDAFYQRYADKNGITLAEARKRVSQMDINAYAAKAKKYVKDRDLSDQANEEMALYNLTMKVNRLEMLKAEMGMALVDGFEEMSGIIDRELTERAMSEYERKAGILGKTVQNPAAKAAAIVNASFHNATWSERLWSHQEALKMEIGRQLMSGLIAGKSSRDMAREIRKIFGGSLQNAQRLMVTELARVQTEAARQSMEANGNTEYEYMATGPHPCPECMKLDGEIFKLKEMQVGVNAPPLHPSCHCCTAPYAGRMRAQLMGIGVESVYEVAGREESVQHSINRDANIKPIDNYSIAGVNKAFKHAHFKTGGLSEREYAIKKDLEKAIELKAAKDKLRELIDSGKLSEKTRFEKQAEHIQGTKARQRREESDRKNSRTNSSFFYEWVNTDEIIERGGKNEVIQILEGKAYWYFTVEVEVGEVYNVGRDKYQASKRVRVEYSKYGRHVIPVKDW